MRTCLKYEVLPAVASCFLLAAAAAVAAAAADFGTVNDVINWIVIVLLFTPPCYN